MNVSVDANEDFLNQVFRLFPITNRPVDEVQQSGLVALDKLLKRALFAAKERTNHRGVILRAEPLPYRRAS